MYDRGGDEISSSSGTASSVPLGAYSRLQEQARQKAAAITIQSFWRAVRARHLATIQRALFKIRQMQDGASKGECAVCVCVIKSF